MQFRIFYFPVVSKALMIKKKANNVGITYKLNKMEFRALHYEEPQKMLIILS